MAEQLSIDRSKMALIIMDYQNQQLSFFSEEFQKEILTRANEVLAKTRCEGIPIIYIEDSEMDSNAEIPSRFKRHTII